MMICGLSVKQGGNLEQITELKSNWINNLFDTEHSKLVYNLFRGRTGYFVYNEYIWSCWDEFAYSLYCIVLFFNLLGLWIRSTSFLFN